jgi:hypothetical protein
MVVKRGMHCSRSGRNLSGRSGSLLGWRKTSKKRSNGETRSKYNKLSAYERTTAKLADFSMQLNAAIAADKWDEAERLYGIASDE